MNTTATVDEHKAGTIVRVRELTALSDAQVLFLLDGQRSTGFVDDLNTAELGRYFSDMPAVEREADRRGIAAEKAPAVPPVVTISPKAAATAEANLVERILSRTKTVFRLKKPTAPEAAVLEVLDRIRMSGTDPRNVSARARLTALTNRLGSFDADQATHHQRMKAAAAAVEHARLLETLGEGSAEAVEAAERAVQVLEREATTRATGREVLNRAIANQRALVDRVAGTVLAELAPAVKAAQRDLLAVAARDLIRFSRSNNLLIALDGLTSGFLALPVGGLHSAALCTAQRGDDYSIHPHGQERASVWLRDVRTAGIDVPEE